MNGSAKMIAKSSLFSPASADERFKVVRAVIKTKATYAMIKSTTPALEVVWVL